MLYKTSACRLILSEMSKNGVCKICIRLDKLSLYFVSLLVIQAIISLYFVCFNAKIIKYFYWDKSNTFQKVRGL